MASNAAPYPPLDQVTAEFLDTDAAAFYAGFRPKTLRAWASAGGPIMPDRKIGRRNRYSVKKLRAFLQEGSR